MALSPPNIDLDTPIAVQVRINREQGSAKTTVVGVAFSYQGTVVEFDLNFYEKPDSSVKVNGVLLSNDNFFEENGISILKSFKKHGEHTYEVVVLDEFTLKIDAIPKQPKSQVELGIRTTYYSEIGPFMSGLCGNYNGDKHDDELPPPLAPGESLFDFEMDFEPPVPAYFCDIEDTVDPLYSQAYEACQSQYVSPEFLSDCLNDVCAAGDPSAAVIYAEITYSEVGKVQLNLNNLAVCQKLHEQ